MTRRIDPGLGGDDRGVSLVLGAMLVTGMALLVFASYRTQVVPQQEANKRAQHLQTVGDELADMATSLETAVANRSQMSTAHTIPLGWQNPSLFLEQQFSGALSFRSDEGDVDLHSNRLVIQRLNDSTRITHPETWSSVNTSGPIEDIDDVFSLRLKLDEISRDMVGDHVVVTAKNATDDQVGVFRICLARHSPDWDIHYIVKDDEDEVVYNNAASHFQNQVYSPFWVNLLSPDYRFGDLLAQAESPLTLNLTVEDDVGAQGGCPGDGADDTGTGELGAEYAITYTKITGTGTVVKGGGGIEEDPYAKTFPSGTLTYRAQSSEGTRKLIVEHGALVLEQADGAYFKLDPPIDVDLAGNLVEVEITLPSLEGQGRSVTGTSSAIVDARPQPAYRVQGEASNFTVNVSTSNPELWEDHWSDRLDDAGLGSPTVETATGDDWARLEVWGLLDSDPASDELDVTVTINQAPIDVELEG